MSKVTLIAFFFPKYLAHKLNTTAFKTPYSKISIVNVLLLEFSIHGNWTINRDIISLIGCRHHTLFKYPDFARGYNDTSEVT